MNLPGDVTLDLGLGASQTVDSNIQMTAEGVMGASLNNIVSRGLEMSQRMKKIAPLICPTVSLDINDVLTITNDKESDHVLEILSKHLDRCGIITLQIYFNFLAMG